MNTIRHFLRAFAGVVFLLLWQPAMLSAQTFSLAQNQLNLALVAGINHLPVSVPIISANFNLANLTVSSDSSWVMPSVDTAGSALDLVFTTANLTHSSYTATITVSGGGQSHTLLVQASLSTLNVIALRDDPTRSRTYGIQQNGLTTGGVVVFDPIQGTYLGTISVGNKPDDLAISGDGNELLVICSVSKSIYTINLQTLQVTGTIGLPNYTDWGQNDTSAHVGYGPGNIIYYTDGAWAPNLNVLNRSTDTIVQSVGIDPSSGNGVGDFVVSGDQTMLFGWAQYGWTAGWAGSYIGKYSINADGTLVFVAATNSNYPTVMARDPLNTPALISADNQQVFLKQLDVSSASVTNTLHSFSSPVYAISPNAEIASTQSSIYQVSTGNKLYDLPVNSTVQVITSDYARLVYFNANTQALETVNLLQTVGATVLGQNISPGNQSITVAPTELQWTAVPGIKQYQVYLGTSATAVAQATNSSPEYQGQVTGSTFTLTAPLSAGTTYYWRVDPVTANSIGTGDVESFTVATIAASVSSVNVATVQGDAHHPASIDLTSSTGGENWTATSSAGWVSFVTNNGTTPATLQVILDASQLSPGLNQANITITGNTGSYTIPVNLQVDPLTLTVIRSDPDSAMVYAVSEAPTTGTTTHAYLLEIDSQNQVINRVVPVGTGVTDLAIHHGDNRIYVTNWLIGNLLAVDLDTFTVAQTYGVPPFAGVGYSTSDVYRISPGGPGRLVVEAEDQWINVSIFDTTTGTVLATTGEREGGGTFDPTGRYYYHGDDNDSNAALHKYDTAGDKFTALGSTDQGIAGYYGGRTVVVSEDGHRIFWDGAVYDENLNLIGSTIDTTADYFDPTYTTNCATPNGRFAFGSDIIYDTVENQVAYAMPVNTTISTYNSSSNTLVLQNGSALGFYVFGSDGPTLSSPVLTVGEVSDSTANLTWTGSPFATGYTLQERVTGTEDWFNVSNAIGTGTTSYNVTGLTAETSYDFRLNANSPEASSGWSNIVTLTTPPTPPPVPYSYWEDNNADGPGSITLNWNVDGNDDSVVVERSTDGVNWTIVATLSSGATTFTDTGLTSSTTYSYRLYTTLSGQTSDFSNVINVTTDEAPPPPTTPLFVIAAADSDTNVGIFWLGSTGADNFLLERASNGGPWTVIANISANTTYYTDTNLTPSTWYAYQVVAENAGGAAQPSVTAWVETYSQINNWLLANYGTALATAQTNPLTADLDGVKNLAKFAFNLTVGQSAVIETVGTGTAGLPAIWLDPDTQRLCVEFVRRKSALNPGVTYTVEFSNDLVTWTPGGTLILTQSIDSIWERVRYQDDISLPNPATLRRFARVIVTQSN